MIAVDLDVLNSCQKHIMDHSKLMSKKLQELREVSTSFKSLSSMNGVSISLKVCESEMEKEINDLQLLSKTLETIISYYQHCEEKIVNRYEMAFLRYQKNDMGFIDLSQFRSYLKEIYR